MDNKKSDNSMACEKEEYTLLKPQENESKIIINSENVHILQKSPINTNEIIYNSTYLNNIIIEGTNTLNSMRKIISNFGFEPKIKIDHANDQFNEQYENHIKNNTEYQQLLNQPDRDKNEKVLTPQIESQKYEKLKTTDHEQFKDKTTISSEMKMLINLVKNIFQKLDDPNYKCENEACQLLRDQQNKDHTKNQNISSNKNLNTVKKSSTFKKEPNKDNIPTDKQKTNKPLFTPGNLVKNLKVDPTCKEKMEKLLKINKSLNNKTLCTCSSIEEYYRQEGCSYIYYAGRILVITCPND